MSTDRGRIVIIDDKSEEGEPIARALWLAGLPVLFAKFDPETWMAEDAPFKNMEGVRVVLLDIDLLGSSMKGSEDQLFGTAATAMETILHDNNGPYLLIAWTNYDDQASALKSYLQKRLSPSKRPILFRKLAKEDYLSGGKTEFELRNSVLNFIEEFPPIRALSAWEGSVQIAAGGVVSDIINTVVASEPADERTFAARLATLLRDLAEAEDGKHVKPEDVSRPLASVLTFLLSDQLSSRGFRTVPLAEIDPLPEAIAMDWRRRINLMLNFDTAVSPPAPGTLHEYPIGDKHNLPIPILSTKEAGKLLRGNFLNPGASELTTPEKSAIEASSSLLLMDITPPCDHAQRKSVWRRYIVGAKILENHWTHVWEKDEKKEPIEGRCGQNLWVSPPMKPLGKSDSFRLIFNSRLIVSIQDNADSSGRLKSSSKVVGRLRERIFTDILGWFGRQATRTGHLSLK